MPFGRLFVSGLLILWLVGAAPAQKPGFQYWTDAYTRRHTFRDTIKMDVCQGYPVVEVGLGDSLRKHRALLSLASASYLLPSVIQEYHLRTGSPRTPDHHKLGPADLPITTLMSLTTGSVEFEGVDAFVTDEGLTGLLKSCKADLLLGCNFLSAAVWAFYPEKKVAVTASRKSLIRFPDSDAWEGLWKGKLWTPFLWKTFTIGDTSLVLHPEFSFGLSPQYLLVPEIFARFRHKGFISCSSEEDCHLSVKISGKQFRVSAVQQRFNAWRFAGSRGEAVMTDLLNRKIYLAR